MNLLTSALFSGYTQKQLIDFLARKFPQHADKIRAAVAMGFTPNQVLSYLGGGRKEVTKQPQRGALTEHERTRASEKAATSRINQGALAAGGIALGGVLASRLPGLLSAAGYSPQPPTPNPTFPTNRAPLPHQLPPAQTLPPVTNTPSPMPPIGPRGGATVPQPVNVPAAPGLPPQKALPTPVVEKPAQQESLASPSSTAQSSPFEATEDSGAILAKLGLKDRVEKMRHQGKSPEMILRVLDKVAPKEMKQQVNLKEVLNDYLSQSPATRLAKLPQNAGIKFKGILEPFENKPLNPEDYQTKPEDVKPLYKGSLAIGPTGKIGEIKAKAGADFILDEGGKGVKVKAEQLEQEPADVSEIVENILKIPEVDRSSVVSLFTYDPEDRVMYIQYHNGETYKYLDVDPEEVREVAEKNSIPVTEGKSMYGAWSPDDKKSLGAALIKRFLQNPKYKKAKAGEPANPNYKKLETLYDYWEKLRKKPKRKS
jgi:hypothetical protein